MRHLTAMMAVALAQLTVGASAAAQFESAEDRRPAAQILAAIDALPLATFCGAEGALGHSWRSTDLPPLPRQLRALAPARLDAAMAPFKTATLSSTDWSNRFYSADLMIQLADAATAQAAAKRLAARYAAEGWAKRAEEEAGLFDDPGDDLRLYRAPKAGSGPDARIDIGTTESVLRVSCTDAGQIADQTAEALGELPPGEPRPQPPALPPLAQLTPEMCTTAEGRAAISAAVGSGEGAFAQVIRAGDYRHRLVQWKTDRLRKSGKIEPEALADLLLSSLDAPGGDPMAMIKGAQDMLTALSAYDDARRKGDAVGECRALRGFVQLAERADKNAAPMFDAQNAALDAAAKRLGVALE